MNDKINKLSKEAKKLPDKPGVYLFKDANKQVIYIGKALSLKKRVSSYFVGRADNLKTRNLIKKIRFFDYILAHSEAEALLYEAQLIKQHLPKYNILLKDGKAYPLLKLTVAELFPRLTITRKKRDDGALYFGPYTDGGLLKEALKILRRSFPLRSCAKLPKKPCLYYHLKQCLAPCKQNIDTVLYNQAVAELVMFLRGNYAKLIAKLKRKMKFYSDRKLYEEAAVIRDQIYALSKISRSEKSFIFSNVAQDLKRKLKLKRIPINIDAFDVSNIFGNQSVGASVRFKDGLPDKSNYRRFKIKSIKGIDDYAMMKEIVTRRYKNIHKKSLLPDLIVIDGGRGHLNAALAALKNLKVEIPIISIAKEKEEIFFVDRPKQLILQPYDKSLRFIQRLRDEVHRFAISYHRILRNKVTKASVLREIKGIGPKKYKVLMNHYSTIEKIKKANIKDLIKIPLIDEKTAQEITNFFKKID
jgi:excinuclease ABC subunit C